MCPEAIEVYGGVVRKGSECGEPLLVQWQVLLAHGPVYCLCLKNLHTNTAESNVQTFRL